MGSASGDGRWSFFLSLRSISCSRLMTRGESVRRVMPLRGPRVASSVSSTRARSFLLLSAAAECAAESLDDCESWNRTDLLDGSLSESPESKCRMKRDRKRDFRLESVDGKSLS